MVRVHTHRQPQTPARPLPRGPFSGSLWVYRCHVNQVRPTMCTFQGIPLTSSPSPSHPPRSRLSPWGAAKGSASPEQLHTPRLPFPGVPFMSYLLHLTKLTCFQVRKIRAQCLICFKPHLEDKEKAETRSKHFYYQSPLPVCIYCICRFAFFFFSGSVYVGELLVDLWDKGLCHFKPSAI